MVLVLCYYFVNYVLFNLYITYKYSVWQLKDIARVTNIIKMGLSDCI